MVESVELKAFIVPHLCNGHAARIQNSRARLMKAVCPRDWRLKLQFFSNSMCFV